MVLSGQGVQHYAKGFMTLGGDGSVMNEPLGAPGNTLLYVCLPPARCSIGGDCYFPSACRNG